MAAYLSRQEAADRLGIGVRTLDRMKAAGRIGYIQFQKGGRVLFTEADIERCMARGQHQEATFKRRKHG